MARHKNESPSPEQQKFIELMALGEVSQAEAYTRAGYSGDRAAASRLARKYAAEISLAREKLGLPSKIEAEPEAIDDDEVRELVTQNRALYEAAVAAGNIGAARKSLTAIERLLKKTKKPTPATPPPPTPAKPSRWTSAELVSMLLTDEEEAEIAGKYAPADEARSRWLRGEVRTLDHLHLLPSDQRLPTQIVGDEDASREDLLASVSPLVLEQAEIVRRL